MSHNLKKPWLIAIWPGMGSVALTAGTYLSTQLGAKEIMRLPSDEHFDVEKVEIQDGVARVGWLPTCSFHAWRDPHEERDLVFFIGEAQPNTRGLEFCRRIIEVAKDLGVQRIYTFAAMATQIHPSAAPRVFAVANEKKLLKELETAPVEVLREGQINGLNGVLLAAAAEAGMGAFCLLGEMPFFAVSVPNPKASHRVLEIFTGLASINVDFSELAAQSKAVERRLVELLERMNLTIEASTGAEGQEELTVIPDFLPEELQEQPDLSARDRKRIETLFDAAIIDRSKALELKHELDRLGVFHQFEDRFLDLFKQGE